MQEDAIRRVREMQRRSRSMVDNSEDHQPPPAEDPKPEPGSDILSSILGSGGRELFRLDNIKIDEEKALIGLLIYILYKQGADVKLLLGLGYLLL